MKKHKIKNNEVKKAYELIKSGGLVIIPSRVGYTLFGNTNKAIKKMFELKGRPLTKPCVVLTRRDFIEDIAHIKPKYLPFIDQIEKDGLLCGFILSRKDHPHFNSLDEFTNDYSKRPDGTSCFVLNSGIYGKHLVDESVKDKTFVVGSSANTSGTGNEGYFGSIPANIRENVDYALEDDHYVSQEYNPITREQGVMVDLTSDVPVITRKGLRYSQIKALLDEIIGEVKILDSAERPSSS